MTLVSFQRGLLLALFEPSVAQSLGVPVSRLNYLLITLIVLAMIASLQAVGVVLSVGLLVLPAATVYLLSDSYRALSWYGGLLGAVGACAGLLLSYWADIPSGPAIVLVLGACFVAALVFGPALRRAGDGCGLHTISTDSRSRAGKRPPQRRKTAAGVT